MNGNRPTCNWCGKPIMGAPVTITNGPSEYTVHEECRAPTEAHLAEEDE
jgi:ribosome-binding protein aMBF1 (putative translation factor)